MISKEMIELLEDHDIKCYITDDDIELEWYSPSGEDFIIAFEAKDDAEFGYNFKKSAQDFDPDEHAEEWMPQRGQNGVPDSIREIIDDADAIKDFLEEMSCRIDAELSRKRE